MKKAIMIFLVLISTITCFGQSLFFDNINNSTWKTVIFYNDSTIGASNRIELSKVNHSLDSLKVNVTVWTFKDGFLTIKYYDHILKQDSLIATYKYQTNPDKGILEIVFNDNQRLEYEVGIISTGNFITLSRKKKK